MRLKDKQLQEVFDRDGAIVITNVLSKLAINEVVELSEKLEIERLGTTYTNVKDKDEEYNVKVEKVFSRLFKDKIESYFEDYQIGGGAFLIKGIGRNSGALLHQDWTVVDESKYKSAVVFCPVHDVNENNGCIHVLKGSHKWFKNIRGLHNPSPILEFSKTPKGLTAFPLKAGDALIFNHNVIHGSKPNYSDQNRIAAMISLASKEAKYIHYLKENKEFKVIEADSAFISKNFGRMKKNLPIDAEVVDRFKIEPGMILTVEDYEREYVSRHKNKILYKLKELVTVG